eukprot:TRINITY_DN1743_c0_g1_i2.p1 TRINITY_DN1743_c0_g1~~TRINITY_DN1743_c0_g1_i2.p1  ORF type:complete len:290 (-),score=54.57 TRINITY_DN1743_c0_g1_i2:819-1688(-)
MSDEENADVPPEEATPEESGDVEGETEADNGESENAVDSDQAPPEENGSRPSSAPPPVEEVVVPVPVPLTAADVAAGLSQLARTSEGISHAFVRLEIKSKDVTEIDVLENYPHLRFVDISSNKVESIKGLNLLNNLIVVNVSNNALATLDLSRKAYLQILNASNNRIAEVGSLDLPLLRELNLNNNQLASLPSFAKGVALPVLKSLELRSNKFAETPALDLPSLKSLWLAENAIKTAKDLGTLTGLETLHLRGNQLATLDGFDGLASLTHLNLRYLLFVMSYRPAWSSA